MPTQFDIDCLDNRDPVWVDRFARWVVPPAARYFRADVRGLDRVPPGPALYVGNHSGGFLSPDTWIFFAAAYRELGIDAVPHGLAHEVALEFPGVHQVLSRLGAVRASPDNARRLFESGKKALVYPGGDLDAFRPSSLRDQVVFGPRRGYVRLALREGVPIVPVVAAGSHDTFRVLTDGKALAKMLGVRRLLRTDVLPIVLSLPWGLTIGAPLLYIPLRTRILIEALEPMRFDRTGEEAASDAAYVEVCHERVLGTMQAALDRLAKERRALA